MKSKGIFMTLAFVMSAFFLNLTAAADQPVKAKNPTVVIKTSLGTFEAILYKDKAPISVENFLQYVKDKAYDGTVMHRVIPNFMIQGGGFNENFDKVKTRAAIKNEAKNGLKNKRGTLAMARTGAVDSATNQFFINLKHNNFLDNGVRDFGYAIFGKVTKGLDIVDKIAKVSTGSKGPFAKNCPKTNVVIESIRLK